uniref:Hexosyltransferase n=1 Tax=Branchiostoma floridae TaxID=7739 RepID=C3Y7Y1_BRAFL|eukprot:XP_002607626.1 hypothetical protein BRAFLDRAFT_84685 [Branchiostoma floridae]
MGRNGRAVSAILLLSVAGAVLHIHLMQKRVRNLEHRFSQLQTDGDEIAGKETVLEATRLKREKTRLVQKSYRATGEVQHRRGPLVEHELRTANSKEDKLRTANSKEDKLRTANSKEDKLRTANSKEDKLRTANSKEDKLRTANSKEDKLRTANSIEHEQRIAGSIEHEHRMAGSIESKLGQDVIQAVSEDTQRDNYNKLVEKVLLRLTTVPDKGSETGVVNPHPYSFVINNPGKCENRDVFLLIVVTSLVENMRQRNGIRQTWGKESNMAGVGIKTVFAIGRTGDVAKQTALEEENRIYRDIIQEDFDDTHRNATLKTIMCLRWASQFCANAEFVLKATDNTFVNRVPFMNYLQGLQNRNIKGLLMGYTYSGTKPLRDPFFIPKWYVSEDDFPRDVYPRYAAGFAFVISNDILRPLYEVSFKVKYLFIEDVYVGLCAEKLGIDPTHHDGFYPIFVDVNYCGLDWLLASHGVTEPELMTKFWLIINACRRVPQ